MAVYTKSSTPAADAARLNLLEEKVRNIAPGEGEDLTSVIAALNRLYDMTMRGGTHGANPDGDITSDLEDDMFWFRQPSAGETASKSIITVTYGDTDGLDRVKNVPFYDQVFGESSGWNFVAPPLGDQDEYSLAGTIFSLPSDLSDIRARDKTVLGLMFSSAGTDWRDFIDAHGSILRAMYGAFGFETDPDASTKSLLSIIRGLEAKIVDLESRVEWLENH
ncbi:hypothetical protein FHL81_10770 [Agrobacterium tumefaciens]|uniref:hypothetical protein n=1 Tax=Agrobacterium tumefaciens TaxID=358 RepID=UPI0011F0BE86|nr:hypothetical protein [Agrobacterium tumefaciens]KAA1237113.1 hypothetical protein FHL81_10770 [Agrobacterium tumefaciens]